MLPCFVFSIAYYTVGNGTDAADNGLIMEHWVGLMMLMIQIEGEK